MEVLLFADENLTIPIWQNTEIGNWAIWVSFVFSQLFHGYSVCTSFRHYAKDYFVDDVCGVSVDAIVKKVPSSDRLYFVMCISDREKKLKYMFYSDAGTGIRRYILAASSAEDAKYLRAIITLAI